jgi:hypothetical protein
MYVAAGFNVVVPPATGNGRSLAISVGMPVIDPAISQERGNTCKEYQLFS